MPTRKLKTRSVSRPTRADQSSPSFKLDHLYDDLEKIFKPIGYLPARYGRLEDYSTIAEKELADFGKLNEQIKNILEQKIDPLGISRIKVKKILWQWWNPCDDGMIEQLATAIKNGRDKLLSETKRAMAIQRVVSKIDACHAPARERFLTYRDRFLDSLKNDVIESLNRELSCYQQALKVLKRAHASALNRHPRTTLPTTRNAVLALHQLLSRKVPERLRRAQLIYSILHAWNSHKAPSSPEAIRTGYR